MLNSEARCQGGKLDVATTASKLNLAPFLGSCFETPFNTNTEFRDRNRLHLLKTVIGAGRLAIIRTPSYDY